MEFQEKNLGEAFSSIDLVGQCLIDETRSIAFENAIKSVIKNDHTVIDMGTGSGIMALFAARSGAQKVYALEFDNFVFKIAEKNINNSDYSNKIILLEGDARNFVYEKGIHLDTVIAEMLTTGMIDEYQVEAVNNLFDQGVVNEKTIFVPKSQKTYITLVNSNFEIYGFKMKMVKHLWNNLSENQSISKISNTKILNTISFSQKNDLFFEKIIKFEIESDGLVNSLYITSEVQLTNILSIKDTETLNAPVVWPIDDVQAKKGDTLEYKISYRFGGGYQNFNITKI